MKIRFYNARILNINEDGIKLIEGELHTDNDKISFVGTKEEAAKVLKDQTFDTEKDLEKNLLMPGFKNAHTHSAMTLFRSYADDLPLQEWLYNKIFPMEAKLTEEDVYWGVRLAILEYLSSGITSIFDMYMKMDSTVKASTDAGFRTVLCESINDFGGSIEQVEKDFLRFNKETNPELSDLISYQLGFHAEYTTKRETLEGLSELANKYKKPICTHNSETQKEVNECIERYGMTPTTFLNSLGLYNYGGATFHGIYLTEEDMEISKEKNVHIVTNPSSNLKLASGIAHVDELVKKGINVAIGTDGPASNNCLDMFREMFLVTGLQKVQNMDAACMDGDTVLKMACYNGAHAMYLDDCDELAVDKKADLTVINLKTPNMNPILNISKNIVYAGSKSNIKMTVVNGQILYEDGKYNCFNTTEEEIYAKANECIDGIKKRLNEG
ncbi:MAG: amidohydrolase [Lachnospiraceae bacterium]|nr:amidohydrolase [Lachnospiraceae bacterium]